MMQNTLHKQTARFISAVSANLPELDADVMQGWIQNPKSLQEILACALCPPRRFTATLDYSQSLATMIQLGKYDWASGCITAERFPLTGEGKWEVEYELGHLNQNISSKDAVAEIKKRGLEPAETEELLAFGAKYPELQRQFPIVALGSVTDGDGERGRACLCRRGVMRDLDLYYCDDGWLACFRFLAVKSRHRIDQQTTSSQELELDPFIRNYMRHVGP